MHDNNDFATARVGDKLDSLAVVVRQLADGLNFDLHHSKMVVVGLKRYFCMVSGPSIL